MEMLHKKKYNQSLSNCFLETKNDVNEGSFNGEILNIDIPYFKDLGTLKDMEFEDLF